MTTIPKLVLIYLSLATVAAPSFGRAPDGFRQAKSMAEDIYKDHKTTFYCSCDFTRKGRTLKISPSRCGYVPRNAFTRAGKVNSRAERVEWEHVVPAYDFGRNRQCWKSYKDAKGKRVSGRKNCVNTDPVFRQMEADLRNLVPSVGELNADRSNYRFSMLEGEERAYGQCDFEVDSQYRKVEPAPHIRGDIARTYLYMTKTYGLDLSRQQGQLFSAWNKEDPVDEWECKRERRIQRITHTTFDYLDQQCAERGL